MKQITAVLLGAGQRGAEAYASYALNHPDELKFVAVAEPRESRRAEFAALHQIPNEQCFESWKEVFTKPKMADCILICTQDQMHFEPLQRAMELGYHILCEKPVTPVYEELLTLQEQAKSYPQVFSVAHVLRFSPFFREIHRLLEAGTIGEIVDIQHIECVGYWHMAHSFVRGNWRNKEESAPMILAKCCHDLDMLLWLVGTKCERVSSFGSLKLFKEENAPEGSRARCMDGCEVREECPFYAPRFYLEHPKAEIDGFRKVVSQDTSAGAVLEALRKGPYGRCVYHCDNDVVDHQVVNLEFEGGVTASLTMCAFTNRCERQIQIMGTKGQITGRMEDNLVEVTDFVTGHHTRTILHAPEGGHSGSDAAMMQSFVRLVASDGARENVAAAGEAIQSHLIALAAEESRLNHGNVVSLESFSRDYKCKKEQINESGN